MTVAFDTYLPSDSHTTAVAVSFSGKNSVVASPRGGVWVESIGDFSPAPLNVFSYNADAVGIFGHSRELYVLGAGDHMTVVSGYDFSEEFHARIQPGTIHTAAHGQGRHVGCITPAGRVVLVDESSTVHSTGWRIMDGEHVVWSEDAYPVGVMSTQGDHVRLTLSYRVGANPYEVTSECGMTVFSAVRDTIAKRVEAYITTFDAPHILKRLIQPEVGPGRCDEVFRTTHPITDVVSYTNGRPIVAVSHQGAIVHADIIDDRHPLARTIVGDVCNPGYSSTLVCRGEQSLLGYRSTPTTPTTAYIISRPSSSRGHDIVSSRTRPMDEGQYVVPKDYRTLTLSGAKDDEPIGVCVVSPFVIETSHTPVAVIICDDTGMVARGRYSASVEMLYRMRIPVFIVDTSRHIDDKATCDTLGRVASYMTNTVSLCHDVCVIAGAHDGAGVAMALAKRSTPLRNAILVDPDGKEEEWITKRNAHKVTSVTSADCSGGFSDIKKICATYIG